MRWCSKFATTVFAFAFGAIVSAQTLGPPGGGAGTIGTGVAFQGIVNSAAGITSTTPLMLGLGSTCTITPINTTRVFLLITGELSGSTTGAQVTIHARFGTGTAPANAAAVTGTVVGASNAGLANPANYITGVAVGGIITGLTRGQAIWIDADISATAGTGFLAPAQCTVFEF